eukprot:Hpha_TRINITY_DN14081_c0_g3::TRINITY_DN14081_c0_g3_i1::g.44295::m.44295/K11498/CENPE; centromeric protein E
MSYRRVPSGRSGPQTPRDRASPRIDNRYDTRLLSDDGREAAADGWRFMHTDQPREQAPLQDQVFMEVAVRLRPPPSHPELQDASMLWKAAGLHWSWEGQEVYNEEWRQRFCFRHVFGPATTTEDVYRSTARKAVLQALGGHNACIFAYGQTNSGKTYSIVGSHEAPGMIPLACVEAFNLIRDSADGLAMLLRVSYLEIYNETVKDLLGEGDDLKICEDEQGECVAQGCTEEIVSCLDDVLDIIRRGNVRRASGWNNVHEHASRSHAVFQLVVERRDFDTQAIRVARLSFVDLAGSETNYQSMESTPVDVLDKIKDQTSIAARLAASSPSAMRKKEREVVRQREGHNIRKSLNALVRVVQMLASGRDGYVPYRDSKLTRLLRHALGGNSHTCCVCTINPEEEKETLSTLRFASAAQHVQTTPRLVAVANDKAMITRLESNLRMLRKDIYVQQSAKDEEMTELKEQHGAEAEELRETIQEREEQLDLLQRRVAGLQRYILDSKTTAQLPTTLSGHYRVRNGHGGGKTKAMLERAERGESEPRPSGGTCQRRSYSLPEEMLRDSDSKSLFGIATTNASHKDSEAVNMLRLANSEAVKEFHQAAAGRLAQQRLSQIEAMQKESAELQAEHATQREKIAKHESVISNLESSVREADDERDASTRELDALRGALERAATAREAAEEELHALQRRAEMEQESTVGGEPFGTEVDELRQRLESAEKELQEQTQRATTAQSEMQKLREAVTAKDGEMAQVKRSMEEAQKQQSDKQGGCCVVQ